MKNTRRSLTLKIVLSYILAAVLATVAFWVIFAQISSFTEHAEVQDENSQKLFLISDILTNMYEAESYMLNIIKTGDPEKVEQYKVKIDTILSMINTIGGASQDSLQLQKIDSLKKLIVSKNKNLDDLAAIYKERKQKGLYATAITELKKSNSSFEELDYDSRFKNLKPDFRQRLIRILGLSREDNAKRLSNQTVDSLTTSVRQVLADLERKDKQKKKQISKRENLLLKNDQVISKQLRDYLTAVEQNEVKASFARVSSSQEILSRTTQIIALVAVLSIILVLVFLVLITKDISRSQEYRSQLEKAKSYAESLLKSKESFMNMVTHDLRSPLNTVLGYSELLQKTDLDKKQSHYLNSLRKSSDYTMHLVNDLLDLSKLEAGKMHLEKLPFYPKNLLQEVITLAIPVTNPDKDIDIQVQIAESLSTQVLGDPFRLKQVLTNLITNAYKFTSQGSITIEGKYDETFVDKTQKTLIVSIQDTGIGMSEDQQKVVFDEFAQADSSTHEKYGGFGLGLAISHRIITLLGGRITLDSTLGTGSTFTIYVPVQKVSSYTQGEKDVSIAQKDPIFEGKRVLVIDDEPAQVLLTKEVISNLGAEVTTAANVDQGLTKLREQSYDCVLTDIQMPGKSGFDLLLIAQQQNIIQNTPVIALSGRSDITREDYQQKGFTDSIKKPYVPNVLINKLVSIWNIAVAENNTYKESEAGQTTSMFETSDSYSLDELQKFAQDDPESLLAILEVWYDATKTNMEEFNELIRSKETAKIPDLAHKILPMFRQIKAENIVGDLQRLERATQHRLYDRTILSISKEVVVKIENLMVLLKKEVLDTLIKQDA